MSWGLFWGQPQQILSRGAWCHCAVQQHLQKIERNPAQNCFSGNKPCCCRLLYMGTGPAFDLFQFQNVIADFSSVDLHAILDTI